MSDIDQDGSPAVRRDPKTQDPRLWRDDGWTARIIKNEDDDGWAVQMIRDGAREPALTGPWTMGRDKKNPKPLDTNAFHTLVKTATEFIARSEQQLYAQLNKELRVSAMIDELRTDVRVLLKIVPDEEFPHALLTARNVDGDTLGESRVAANFKLTTASATAWIEGGFRTPGGASF